MLKALIPISSAQAVGNSLYGLQQMTDDVPEVRKVLAALTPKIQSCRQPLGNGLLYGLRE
jgi:hypothetical protein